MFKYKLIYLTKWGDKKIDYWKGNNLYYKEIEYNYHEHLFFSCLDIEIEQHKKEIWEDARELKLNDSDKVELKAIEKIRKL